MARTGLLSMIALLVMGCSSNSDSSAGPTTPTPATDASPDTVDQPDSTQGDSAADHDEPASFTKGHLYIAGARNGTIFEYQVVKGTSSSPGTFKLLSRWTDPSFYPDYGSLSELPAAGQAASNGPGGIAFDGQGRLIVAARNKLCAFSAPSVLDGCYDKAPPADGGVDDAGPEGEATYNIVIDTAGNVFVSDSSGARNEVQMYGPDLTFKQSIPVGGGKTVGLGCDTQRNLYAATQNPAAWPYASTVSLFPWDGTNQVYSTAASSTPISGLVESILLLDATTLLAACHDDQDVALPPGIRKINIADGTVVPPVLADTADDAGASHGLFLPMGVTIDADGAVYTADWQNALGTEGADLYAFDADGSILAKKEASDVLGPTGMAVYGATLFCGPPNH